MPAGLWPSRKLMRFWGVVNAVALPIVLLLRAAQLLDAPAAPIYMSGWEGVIESGITCATVAFFLGGIPIIFTAANGSRHFLSIERLHTDVEGKSGASAKQVLALIVFADLIISSGLILSATAIPGALGCDPDLLPRNSASRRRGGVRFRAELDVRTAQALCPVGRGHGSARRYGGAAREVEAAHTQEHLASRTHHDNAPAIKALGNALLPMLKTTLHVSLTMILAVEIFPLAYMRKLDAERAAA